jgi:hypothetical protein
MIPNPPNVILYGGLVYDYELAEAQGQLPPLLHGGVLGAVLFVALGDVSGFTDE